MLNPSYWGNQIGCEFKSLLTHHEQTPPRNHGEDKTLEFGALFEGHPQGIWGVGIQFKHSEALRCNSRSKNGQYCSKRRPRVMDLCAVLLKSFFFTGRPGRMTIAVIAGPSYIPKFTILPCFPVASEWSNGERIQQYPAVDGNKRKASDLYDSERWFLPLHSSRDASRIGIVVMQSLTFRKGPSSQIGEGSPG